MSGQSGVATKGYWLKSGEGETISFVGERARVLADAATTGGRCFIFEETTPAGVGPPLHRHGIDDEFFYILEGRFRFVMDGREFIAEPGAFLSVPKGSVHTFVNVGAGPGLEEGRMRGFRQLLPAVAGQTAAIG